MCFQRAVPRRSLCSAFVMKGYPRERQLATKFRRARRAVRLGLTNPQLTFRSARSRCCGSRRPLLAVTAVTMSRSGRLALAATAATVIGVGAYIYWGRAARDADGGLRDGERRPRLGRRRRSRRPGRSTRSPRCRSARTSPDRFRPSTSTSTRRSPRGSASPRSIPAPFQVKVQQRRGEPGERARQGAEGRAPTSSSRSSRLERNRELRGKNLISQNDLDTAQEQLRSGGGAAGARSRPACSRPRRRCRRRASTWPTPTSCRRSTASSCRATSTSARPSPPASRRRRCS